MNGASTTSKCPLLAGDVTGTSSILSHTIRNRSLLVASTMAAPKHRKAARKTHTSSASDYTLTCFETHLSAAHP